MGGGDSPNVVETPSSSPSACRWRGRPRSVTKRHCPGDGMVESSRSARLRRKGVSGYRVGRKLKRDDPSTSRQVIAGMTDNAGYVVATSAGNVVFMTDRTQRRSSGLPPGPAWARTPAPAEVTLIRRPSPTPHLLADANRGDLACLCRRRSLWNS